MNLTVKRWPESQDVMDKDDWFSIMAGDGERNPFGDSAYAKIIEEEYVLVKMLDIAREELKWLASHPSATLNYQQAAQDALNKMEDVSNSKEMKSLQEDEELASEQHNVFVCEKSW